MPVRLVRCAKENPCDHLAESKLFETDSSRRRTLDSPRPYRYTHTVIQSARAQDIPLPNVLMRKGLIGTGRRCIAHNISGFVHNRRRQAAALWTLGLDRALPIEIEGAGVYHDPESFWNVLLEFDIKYR